jgi:threonine/homoserine/homoserine lactone efflux protein
MSIALLLTTLVVVATPGTGAVYSIAAGLSRGSRAGIIAAFGCTLGVLPHMVAAIIGVAAILHASKVMLWLRRTFAATYVLLAGRLAAESR